METTAPANTNNSKRTPTLIVVILFSLISLGAAIPIALLSGLMAATAGSPEAGNADPMLLEALGWVGLGFSLVAIVSVIGSVIAFEAMFAGPICGAPMNPARSLAPAVVSGTWRCLWLYLVAPVAGVAVVAPWHRWLFAAQRDARSSDR